MSRHLLKRLASRCLRQFELQRLQDLEQSSLGKASCIDIRWYSSSNLPEDIARAARQAKYPDRQLLYEEACKPAGTTASGSLKSQAASSSSKEALHNSAQEAAAVGALLLCMT